MHINRALFSVSAFNRPVEPATPRISTNASANAVGRPAQTQSDFPRPSSVPPDSVRNPKQHPVEQQAVERKTEHDAEQSTQTVYERLREQQSSKAVIPEIDPLTRDLRFGGGQTSLEQNLNITPAHSQKAVNAYQFTGGNVEKEYVHQMMGIDVFV